MNASAAITNVQARGMGLETGGVQKDCLPSRLVPLAPRLASKRFRDGIHE